MGFRLIWVNRADPVGEGYYRWRTPRDDGIFDAVDGHG